MRELHDIERHRAYSMTASDHITPHPAPLPSTFQDIPVAKPRYRRSAPEHEPLPVIASEKFTEMTRRNREEDRISNLPLEEQPLENAKEMERRRRWDKVYASRIAATQNDGRNTSSTTTNAIISTPVPTTTPVTSSITPSAASPTTTTTPATTTKTPQQPRPKRALAQKLKSLFKPKHSPPNQ